MFSQEPSPDPLAPKPFPNSGDQRRVSMEHPTGLILANLKGLWVRNVLLLENKMDFGSFPGAIFRGGFGYMLRDLLCAKPEIQCDQCHLASSCGYSKIFLALPPQKTRKGLTKGQLPQPFVLRIGQAPKSFRLGELPWGDRSDLRNKRLSSGSILFLDILFLPAAALHITSCLKALADLGRKGIGSRATTTRKAHYRLLSSWTLTPNNQGIHQPGRDIRFSPFQDHYPNIHTPLQLPSLLPEYLASSPHFPSQLSDPIILRIPGGLHLKKNGRFDPTPSLSTLLSSILRRWTRLNEASPLPKLPSKQLAPLIKTILTHATNLGSGVQDFRSIKCHRFSSHQKRHHFIPAIHGDWQLPYGSLQFLPILKMGEKIGVGKGSTFGLGEYQILPQAHQHHVEPSTTNAMDKDGVKEFPQKRTFTFQERRTHMQTISNNRIFPQ